MKKAPEAFTASRHFLRLLLLFGLAKAFVKPVYTSAGINQFLFASVEWMAFAANLNVDVLSGRTGIKLVTASTHNMGCFVLRMDALFHGNSPLLYKEPFVPPPF